MIQRLLPASRRLDKDIHLLAHDLLADVVRQALGSDGTIDGIVFAIGAGRNETGLGH
jgi:hypothetical protein